MTASTPKIRSSKKNPCPVCQNHSGCQFTENFSRVWCLRVTSQWEVPAGYRLTGWLGQGMGASLIAGSEEQDEQRREELRQERQRQREQRLRSEAEKRAESLSEQERDKEIRKLLSQLDLKPEHREDLQRRGLTDEQIKSGMFRSVDRWQKLEFPISHRLAGISIDGRSLTNPAPGYICPIWSVGGLLIGWQLRLDNPSDGPKYLWATSAFKRRPNGPTSHLQNGELPLTVCRPIAGQPKNIRLEEGILKPQVSAQLSGDITIGASGGHFPPQQLEAAIAKLREEFGDLPIILDADAGSAVNRHVYAQACETIRLLQSWGYEPQIADWGQLFDKSRPDFDEYLAAGARTYTLLLADEFLNIHSAPASDRARQPQPRNEEPDAEEYAKYQEWESQQEQAKEGEEQRREQQKEENQKTWQQSYSTRVAYEWSRLKSITKLTKEFAQRYLNIDLDSDILPGIIGVKSPMGTGKTEFLKQIVKKYERGNVLSYRNSLLQNTAGRIPEIDYIWDLEIDGDVELSKTYRRHSAWTAACIDSISKLTPKEVLIIEEAQKFVNHVLRGSTCKRRRAPTLQRFQEFCQKADYIFLMDADLTDIELQYIQSLCPDKRIWTLRNNFIPHQWPIFWYTGSLSEPKEEGEEPKEKPNDRKPFEEVILDAIAAGEIPLIVSDSQQWLEAMDNLIKALYPDKKGIRVDSFTKADNPEVINKFFGAPNPFIAENRPDYVALSPSGESSLDITENHFTVVYGMFVGNIDCYSMRQMLGRYRVPVPRHIFCKTFAKRDNQANNSPLAKVCGKHLHRYEMATIEHLALGSHLKEMARENADIFTLIQALNQIADTESETWRDPHLKAWANYQARDNYQKTNLRQTLRELLEDAGHIIRQKVIHIQEPAATGVSKERKKILQERARRIAESPDIPVEEARKILEDMAATSTQRFMAEKALLKERLPGVELTSEFVYWCKFEEKGVLGNLQNFWMMQHPGCREYLDRNNWVNGLQYNTPIWDIHTRSLELDVLRQLDLAGFADGEWSTDDEEVLALRERAIAIGPRLRLALGISATPTSDPIYLLRRCMEKLGYGIKGKQRRVEGGERKRFYRIIHPESDADRAAVLRAYDHYFFDALNKSKTAYSKGSGECSDVSHAAFQRENTTEKQDVTGELILAEMANNEPTPEATSTWRGLLMRVRATVEFQTEFEKRMFASLPTSVLRVDSEPYLAFRQDDWHVWCEKPEGGVVAIPCAWLEPVAS